jgi:RNA polymerase sigma-70 factor (ECF subfamily)
MKLEDNHADKELIMKLKNHDEQAMIMLYKNYWKSLYISAYKILKNKETCEDIVQELFIKIWNNREQLTINSCIKAYLSASVRYEVFRRLRNSKNHEPILNEIIETVADLSLYDRIEYKELQFKILSVVDTLPGKCREVYNLSRNELLSHKEIADKLAISTKTVRNHITRALHELRMNINHLMMFLITLLFLK